MQLQILSDCLLAEFESQFQPEWIEKLQHIQSKQLAAKDFDYMLTVASVFSSKIEGNSLDLDSFFVAKDNGQNIKEVVEIDDLIVAYQWAMQNNLNEKNHLQVHKILSKNFKALLTTQKGNYRKIKVGIRNNHGLVYLAVEPEFVKREMKKLWQDIKLLLEADLSIQQSFYFASFIHFVFAKIHPFADGNGRAARVLEKWFLAEKLGKDAWGISSEYFYWHHRSAYYQGLNLGLDYYDSMEKINSILPFLQLLPKALI